MAAIKHRIAAIMNGVVSAVMKGVAMALGKKVWLSRMFRVLCGNPAAIGPIPCSNVPMGLYPRKAAKSAPEAGVWLNADAICGGAPVLAIDVASAAGKVVFSEMMIMAKKIA